MDSPRRSIHWPTYISDPALEVAGLVATVVYWIARPPDLNDTVFSMLDLLQGIGLPMVDFADCIAY